MFYIVVFQKFDNEDLPGSPVTESSAANAGDMGSILDVGRLHASEQQRMCAAIPKPSLPRACALQQEKPPQWEACAPLLENSPCSLQLEKAHT